MEVNQTHMGVWIEHLTSLPISPFSQVDLPTATPPLGWKREFNSFPVQPFPCLLPAPVLDLTASAGLPMTVSTSGKTPAFPLVHLGLAL